MSPVHSVSMFPSKLKGRKKAARTVLIHSAEEARLEAISYAVTHGGEIEAAKSIALQWFDECINAPNSIELATEKKLRERLESSLSAKP